MATSLRARLDELERSAAVSRDLSSLTDTELMARLADLLGFLPTHSELQLVIKEMTSGHAETTHRIA